MLLVLDLLRSLFLCCVTRPAMCCSLYFLVKGVIKGVFVLAYYFPPLLLSPQTSASYSFPFHRLSLPLSHLIIFFQFSLICFFVQLFLFKLVFTSLFLLSLLLYSFYFSSIFSAAIFSPVSCSSTFSLPASFSHPVSFSFNFSPCSFSSSLPCLASFSYFLLIFSSSSTS